MPSEAAVWYYFRELDYPHIKDLYDLGNTIADSAAKMTGTTVDHKLVGSAWPPYLNKVIAETQQKNIEAVGMPKWSERTRRWRKLFKRISAQRWKGLKEKVEPLDRTGEKTHRRRIR